jgi:hypothetical protein
MSFIKNSFAVLGVVAVGVIGANFLLSEEQHTKLKTSVMHLIKPDQSDATRKIMVYQSQGKSGEAVFSDRQDGHQSRARVVDSAKGTTFHSEKPKQEDDNALDFKQSSLQQKAAALKQAQMDRAIYQ